MTRNKRQPIHPALKLYSGFKPTTPDVIVRKYFEDVFPTEIEKPCGILEWCPYGALVEAFPLHGEGEYKHKPLADPSPCAVFGHDCPAFYVAEPFSDPDAIADNCVCDECRAALDAENLSGSDEASEEPTAGSDT